jgi:hypothetical protein
MLILKINSLYVFIVLQVIVGWHYSDGCPINQLIPHYLIVAGVIGLLLVILISVTQLLSRTFGKQMFDDDVVDKTNPNRATMLVGCGVCSIMCINLSLFIFLLGWSITGWVWIIEIWHRVQYYPVHSINYCHPILYQLTFALLLITTIFKMIFFCFVCRKTCRRATSNRRKDTITSEEF